MSYVRIWVHLVFTTKNREPFLRKEIRNKVHQHIIENCKHKEIFLQAVNGYNDHLHCLISLGKEQNISKIAPLLPGASSFWVHTHNFVAGKFMWQDDFWAASVSESGVENVTNYIKNQEAHHSKKTFKDEIEILMEECNFEMNEK